jgi:UDP-N-acetyl-2-amino-2-deoxyglucuronate dehydrogenase
MKRLKTALVGTGKVSHLHAAALKTLPESEFVAVCGRSPQRLGEFAAKYGVQGFTDVGEMIRSTGVEALVVCTPHPAHAAPTIAAAREGVHALIEKPFASTLSDCDAMMAAAKAGGATIGIVSQRRLYPACQRIRGALDAGRIGSPVLGFATLLGWRGEEYYRSDPWRGSWKGEGGGVLVNQAPHQLDLLLWYMGEVEEVFGYWANVNHPTIEVEDTAVAVVRFKGGGLGNIMLSNSQNPGISGRVSVHGSNGASVGVQTDGGSMFIAGTSKIADAAFNDIWTVPGEERMPAQWRAEDDALFASVNPMEHFHRLQIADFLQSVAAGRPPAVTAADGRRVVELFTAIYRATRDGRPVRFPVSAQ